MRATSTAALPTAAALALAICSVPSFFVGALYRFTEFAGPTYIWVQHEAYLSTCYSRSRFAVALSTAFIYDESGSAWIGDSFHQGLSGRLSVLGRFSVPIMGLLSPFISGPRGAVWLGFYLTLGLSRVFQETCMTTSVHHLRELALSDTGFLFDPFTGGTFTLNQTGLCVLQSLRDGLGRAEIVARLRDRFDVQAGNPEDDLNDFLHLLGQHGLLPADFIL